MNIQLLNFRKKNKNQKGPLSELVEELKHIKDEISKLKSQQQAILIEVKDMSSSLAEMKQNHSKDIGDLFCYDEILLVPVVTNMECLCVNSSEEKAQKALKNYGREVALRHQYFNVIQEMKDNISVCYRVRSLLQNDISRVK
ncbi:hypothetical protein RFI_34113 [Reticulomyxa filosa]|uniref:Uncharacterized protein n=1 Tax=Reticulomyxa filosa TaxID=46433 RepID=X6LQ78_RETFI|nr:hypothetical protein RFI_34113 [Reticulomyxa filosa]|eukprot:ETO03297.1 hypothetical protein RFI_34113 [Reticulomyxa filosa]